MFPYLHTDDTMNSTLFLGSLEAHCILEGTGPHPGSRRVSHGAVYAEWLLHTATLAIK